jgi:hypothetical protein
MKYSDILKLVKLVGPKGARSALLSSEIISDEDLRKICNERSLETSPKTKRSDLISLLLLEFNRKIDIPYESFTDMSPEDIKNYLTKKNVSKEEITELLKGMNVPLKKIKSKQRLIDFAANSLSGLGLYQRIANHDKTFNNDSIGP